METNDKKPKRPRIGERPAVEGNGEIQPRYEKVTYDPTYHQKQTEQGPAAEGEPTAQRHHDFNNDTNGYSRPSYHGQRNGGYHDRQDGNRQGGYQDRHGGYHQHRQGGYYRQDGNHNNQGGYRNNYREGGYQQGYNNRQGGYQQRHGGYNNYSNDEQGSYQPRNNYRQSQEGYENRQGGYQQRQGGYQQRQGGYQNRNNRQGGYQNRQGGYQNNRQGNYQNRQGGYQKRQGGYNRMPNQGKSFVPRPKRIEYEMPIPDPNEEIRLNKFMANAGICSRREADEFIKQGLVKVNGVPVTELGTKITHKDTVEYDEKVVTLENKCYILLNKPKDCVTSTDDPNGRMTVLDLVKGACDERIYPVGRLDRNTTGVLLLTNDGDLASKLTHPKYVKTKIYHVWTDKDIAEEDMQRIADGIELEDGPIHADAISYATETDRNQAGIEIHSGRNRIVRRIFESLGYHVTKLDRVYFAGLTKKNLPRGRWRYLTQEEVNYLKMGSFE